MIILRRTMHIVPLCSYSRIMQVGKVGRAARLSTSQNHAVGKVGRAARLSTSQNHAVGKWAERHGYQLPRIMQSGRWAERPSRSTSIVSYSAAPALLCVTLRLVKADLLILLVTAIPQRYAELRAGAALGSSRESIGTCRSAHLPNLHDSGILSARSASSQLHDSGNRCDSRRPKAKELIPPQLFAITFKIPLHLTQTVAAKLLAHRGRNSQRNHRLAYHTGCRHRSRIGPLKSGCLGFFCVDIN